MKKYNIKRLVKIKLNIVGADASVRLEKNQNRNNIRTFVKSKSNAVGVGVPKGITDLYSHIRSNNSEMPDDPKTKHRIINKLMSNEISKYYYTFLKIEKDNKTGRRGRRPLQMPKSNLGITLIALIITIIVLLILAGVTLNMVMGENGLFGKANNAKNKTEVAQYEEELRICVLELQTDAAANGTTFNMETIKNKFVEKVKELENTTEIEFPTEESETRLDGTYKGYEFYIDDKYAAHIGDKATGITLTTSINPSGWTQGPVTATITIKSNNGINKVEPDEGSKNGNEYIITKENIAENTSFEYTVTDGQGNTQTKTAAINTIDKDPPEDFTITAENTEEGLKITGKTTDAESGIDKYEYYAKKSTDSEYTKYDSNPITGLASGTYSVYAIAYDKAGNQKQSTNTVENVKISAVYRNITAQMVAEHPETYYGLKVTNYESKNGQNDWKIFHSDGTNIYLITGNYVKVTDDNGNINPLKLNTEGTKMQIADGGKNYRVNWNSSNLPIFNTDVSSEIISKFKINTNVFNINSHKSNKNAQCVSTLLNPNYWTGYIDNSKGNNQTAIGGTTVQLWMDSWNARYPGQKVYCNSANADGYYVWKRSGSETTDISLNKNENEGGELYFANNYNALTDGNNKVNYYWLASTSAGDSGLLINVLYYGRMYIGYNDGDYGNCGGLRPVVCLGSGIKVNAEDAE
mgnify:CR=1 FL=1